MAFYRLEPFGDEWRRTARSTVIVAGALGAKLKEDFEEMFLPTYDPRRPTQTPEEMAREFAKIQEFVTKAKAEKAAAKATK